MAIGTRGANRASALFFPGLVLAHFVYCYRHNINDRLWLSG